MSRIGSMYDEKLDGKRLDRQMDRVRELMLNMKHYHTLDELQKELERRHGGYFSTASISAQYRNLKKAKYGGYVGEPRRRGDPKRGVWEYKLFPPPIPSQTALFEARA